MSALGTSADNVVISTGITAEKLMYDRALEMSRAAAINELTGEDLPGCEIAYVTAIRMLEAVLEKDEVSRPGKGEKAGDAGDKIMLDGVQMEDRQVVLKLVASIRARLTSIRKKLAVINKRASAPPSGATVAKAATNRPGSPAVMSPGVGVSPPR